MAAGPAVERDLCTSCDDHCLLGMIRAADRVAIDAPFGWPDEFFDAITAHRRFGRWPEPRRNNLRFRATDRFVTDRTGRWPLSVSADRFGVTAMRYASLLDQLAQRGEPVNRRGTGKVVEVYPAAALAVRGFDPRGYKKPGGRQKRVHMVKQLLGSRTWLTLTQRARQRCEESDDVFHALVAALVARAVAVGLTDAPPPEHSERALREGWIHLPAYGSVDDRMMS